MNKLRNQSSSDQRSPNQQLNIGLFATESTIDMPNNAMSQILLDDPILNDSRSNIVAGGER